MKQIDLLLFPLYFSIILIIFYSIKKRFYGNSSPHAKHFIPALIIKVAGAIFAGAIYQFYYEGGDTFNFHAMSRVFYDCFLNENISVLIDLFSLDTADYYFKKSDARHYIGYFYSWYFREPSAFFVSKIAGFIGLFCFNSYTIIAMFFAVFSYSGLWLLYLVFYNNSNLSSKKIAWSILYLPSVVFWGSGLFKDTITIGALGFLVYASTLIFINKKVNLSLIIILLISLILLIKIKIYILLCFFPAFLLYIFNAYKKRISSNIIKKTVTPFIIILSIISSFQFIQQLGDSNTKYSFDNALNTIEQTQQWHTMISEKDRTYSLGSYEKSYTGIISKIPEALFISLFRPFLWEARGLLLFLAAIENLLFLFLFIKLTLSGYLNSILKIISNNPILWLCFIFTINLGFVIGFTTFNFGALVRYKIPLIPFYMIGMQIILEEIKFMKESKKRSYRIMN